jgi:plastocyanin
MRRPVSGRSLGLACASGLVALVAAAMLSPAVADSVIPSVTAYNEPGGYYGGKHYWMPSSATVSQGGAVKFINPYTETYHGLKFTGGSAGVSPTCTGIPQAATEPSGAFHWEGECTFSKPGTYTFVCTVHPEMTGTITVPGTLKDKTTAASSELQTEVTLNGSVEPEGNQAQYHFQYGTTSLSEHETASASLSAADFGTSHGVSASISNLKPATTYHFQLVVTYGGTTVVGGEQSFTTLAAAAPTVATTGATVEGENKATLEGTVDPNGGSSTEYFFEYATSAEYEAPKAYSHKTTAVPGIAVDNSEHTASAAISSLEPATTYHFRIVAENAAGGPVVGVDRTFTTASPTHPPKEPQPSPSPEPTPTPTPTPIPTPGPIAPEPEIAPIAPVIVQGSLKLAAGAHTGHAVVHVSLDVSQSGAGGRLEIDLLAKSSSLGSHKHGTKQVDVGRVVRASVVAGKISLSVALNARGRNALHRNHKLALTVKVVLTPRTGAPLSTTHGIALRS